MKRFCTFIRHITGMSNPWVDMLRTRLLENKKIVMANLDNLQDYVNRCYFIEKTTDSMVIREEHSPLIDLISLYESDRATLDAIFYLLYLGANVNHGCKIQNEIVYPLSLALSIKCPLEKYNLLIKVLIKYGANVNTIDSEGSSPLMLAAYRGAFDVVGILLDAGANATIKNKYGQTALDILDIHLNSPQKSIRDLKKDPIYKHLQEKTFKKENK